jgi:hypothetical protein
MTQALRLRRACVATLILTAIITTFPVAAASAMTTQDRAISTHERHASSTVCPIAWRKGPRYVRELIECAARHFGIGPDRALQIAFRESKFRPGAYNTYSCAKGVFQHLCRYWPTRADDYGFAGWSAYNARANIMVTMRMVLRYGWSPWGG